jgi:hypothetical protein
VKDRRFNFTLATAVIQDFQNALTAAGWPASFKSVVVVRQPCMDITVSLAHAACSASCSTLLRRSSDGCVCPVVEISDEIDGQLTVWQPSVS